jgi:hypothetical protein
LLDWLKFAQSETTGIKLYSKDEVQKMNAEFEAVWQEAVEAEVNRRLAERERTLEVEQANISQGSEQLSSRACHAVLLTSDVNKK